ncbi:hypothetical protein OG21DRAFT_1516737 [Imleria badia]|nr:hypothetical protein OG21DRAFT_1516737 [Imleria badia]
MAPWMVRSFFLSSFCSTCKQKVSSPDSEDLVRARYEVSSSVCGSTIFNEHFQINIATQEKWTCVEWARSLQQLRWRASSIREARKSLFSRFFKEIERLPLIDDLFGLPKDMY